MGGGQKFVVRRLQAVGTHVAIITNPGRMVTQPAADFLVGSWNPCRPTVIAGAAVMFARPGFKPPTQKSAVGCITIRPLRALKISFLPTAWIRVCH